MAEFTFPNWSDWIKMHKTQGAKWVVARRMTDELRRQGYEWAVTQRQYAEWEKEYRAEREAAAIRQGPWSIMVTDTYDEGGPANLLNIESGVAVKVDYVKAHIHPSIKTTAREIARLLNLQWAGLIKPVDTFGR